MVEFALVLLPLMITLLAMIEFAFFMFAWVTVEHAAREGLRVAITGADSSGTSPGTSSARLTAIQSAVAGAEAGLPNAAADTTITLNAWNDKTFTTALASGSTTGSGTPAISGYLGYACYALEVQVVYTYRPITPFFRGVAVSYDLMAKERGLNEQYTACGS